MIRLILLFVTLMSTAAMADIVDSADPNLNKGDGMFAGAEGADEYCTPCFRKNAHDGRLKEVVALRDPLSVVTKGSANTPTTRSTEAIK